MSTLPTDLRAAARLAADATVGVSRIAEGVHQSVWSTLGAGRSDGRARGLTGFVYRQVRRTARLASRTADRALGWIPADDASESERRAAFVAALNGVMGDHLAATDNPLATPMTLRHHGAALGESGPLDVPGTAGRVVLFLHGLCLDERCWKGEDVRYADVLARETGATPLHLRYNTGLPVAENGRRLAALLERVLGRWPVPFDRLDAVAHSMGGLVLRSALHAAREAGHSWPDRLRTAVFLGTPHHGAPLERLGNGVDALLGATRFSAPLARIGKLRSAGITDLRFGRVLEGPPGDRFRRGPDLREPLPLPEGIACYAVAATLAPTRIPFASRTLGDGLVPLASALGRHPYPAHRLAFAGTLRRPGTSHFALLHDPETLDALRRWLA